MLTRPHRTRRQDFFECVKGDNSEQAAWFSGIKKKMVRLVFQRDLYGADNMDHTPNELFLEHIVELSEACEQVEWPLK